MVAPDIAPLLSAAPQDRAYEVYRQLRDAAPVLEVPGMRTWLVSTDDGVRAVVRDPTTWSSRSPERLGTGLTPMSPMSQRTAAALANGHPYAPTLLFQDDPEHRRQRSLGQQALNAAFVRRFEGTIAETTHRLVDAFPADGKVHFARDLSVPLPIDVFTAAFGVEPADEARFGRWAHNIAYLGAETDEDANVALAEEYVAFQNYLVERIHRCRGKPGDDLLSRLVNAHLEGDAQPELSLAELLGICTLLLAAGSEPTTAAMNALLYRIVGDPHLMATLRADRSLLPIAIEETLRLDAPVQMFQRRATCATEIGGKPIKQGDMAMVIYASANRDANRWQDPDQFRLDRPNVKDHLAFTTGPHHCFGALLARTELRIAFDILLDRLDRIELDGSQPVEFLPDLMTRAYRELPLIVTRDGG